jgi:hypothetical protein
MKSLNKVGFRLSPCLTPTNDFLTMHNIICPEQISFSKGSRTSDHMFVLKTLIDKYTQQGSKHLYTCHL